MGTSLASLPWAPGAPFSQSFSVRDFASAPLAGRLGSEKQVKQTNARKGAAQVLRAWEGRRSIIVKDSKELGEDAGKAPVSERGYFLIEWASLVPMWPARVRW